MQEEPTHILGRIKSNTWMPPRTSATVEAQLNTSAVQPVETGSLLGRNYILIPIQDIKLGRLLIKLCGTTVHTVTIAPPT